CLRNRIESRSAGIRAIRSKRGHTRKNNVRFHSAERLIINSHFSKHGIGKICDNDVGPSNQPTDDFARFFNARIERQAALVTVKGKEMTALSVRRHRPDEAVLAPVPAIYPDDVSAHIGEEHSAVRTSNVAAEISDTD